jgi:predicted nucleic acid-binding protein
MAAKITHIVDANAVIAYFKGEEGHEIVADLLRDEENVLAIHAVQLCEVYYGYYRADGQEIADRAWQRALEIVRFLPEISETFIKRVGRWKARRWERDGQGYYLSIADAFAAATAEEYACPLVTKDHNDFSAIEEAGALQIVWL